MPITITCTSAPTASQNVSCRQCFRELAKNTKHHALQNCLSIKSIKFATPTQNKWLVSKLIMGCVIDSPTETSGASAHQTVGMLSFLYPTQLTVSRNEASGECVVDCRGSRVTVDMSHVCTVRDCHLSLVPP